jgi:hypothetical protein
MVLNTHTADPSSLKVMILSCPKTGNTWLRWLIHYAYRLPIVDIPLVWSDEVGQGLPGAFVAHQHTWPCSDQVQWMVENGVVALTTIRHPADTLLSYFNFAKWNDMSADPAAALMARDGDRPGRNTFNFVKHAYAQAYSISLAWGRLGAHVVRYEDLLDDPVGKLRTVTSQIAPLDDYKIKAAVFLCKPEQMTRTGIVDARHLRTATAKTWIREMPADIIDLMAGMEPYKSACETYKYDWDTTASPPLRFDYDLIDPFRGRAFFDNGEPIGLSLAQIYLHEAIDAPLRWPDPTLTGGDSFWHWLLSPSDQAGLNVDLPPFSYSNAMAVVHGMRPDLQAAFPDPVGNDRIEYLAWFVAHAATEHELPWGLMSPILDYYCDHIGAKEIANSSIEFGRIARIAVIDARGWEANTFACGDDIRIELQLVLDHPVENAVIGYSLRGDDGRLAFGTNTTILGTPLPALGAGIHTCTIHSKLTIPPQNCYVSVGLARYDDAGRAQAIHRIFDHKRITVTGVASGGASWCETVFSMKSAAQAVKLQTPLPTSSLP